MARKFGEEHLNKRVMYTARSGTSSFGSLRKVGIGPDSSPMVDVKLDGSTREYFAIPEDMVELVPDELASTLGSPD